MGVPEKYFAMPTGKAIGWIFIFNSNQEGKTKRI